MNIRAGFFAAMVLAVCMLAGSRTGAAAASATLALAPDNGASDGSFSAVYSVRLGLNEKTCPQAKLTLQWDGVDIGSAVLNGCSTTFGSSSER